MMTDIDDEIYQHLECQHRYWLIKKIAMCRSKADTKLMVHQVEEIPIILLQ